MTELEVYIREGFGVVDPTELAKISTLFTYSKLEKGDFLLQENNKCEGLSFVQSGYLRMFALIDGKEVTQWVS